MEIRIYNLKLKNFKGIKELQIEFNRKDTNIFGANATGKTTVFDAFKWLFFDKDSNDRKDFNIKTLDENNNPIHFLEHEVEATLIIDGQDITFRKMLKEKWVKRRGQENQEFAGHETNYWIDEVPVKKKDYEEKINSLIPESLFKLITDSSFFNNVMSWKERRELLISISGSNITDEDILNSDEKFATLKENLQGRKIDDYKKVIIAKVKELNTEKEKIPVRIDELTNTLITEHNIDYNKLEEEKETLNQELHKINLEMTDIQARAKENLKKADQLAIAKNELNNLKFKLETENSNKNSKEEIILNNEKTVLENSLRNSNKQLEELTFNIEKDQKRKEELYKQWDEVNNTKLEFDPNSFICPTCKREYETDKIEEMKQQFEKNFVEHKESRKEEINKEGQSINKRIEESKENITKLKNQIEESTIKLSEINTKIEKFKSEKEEIENIDKQLNEKNVQERTAMRIEELKSEEENISQKIQELESQEFQIEEFIKTKVELLENAINSNFEIVKFRLFDTQINGGLIECCDTLVNGVPYSDVNNAHKIIAGLDIIKTLSRFYNTTAPIFIDNRESINDLCKINAQIISLVVTTDPKLRIGVMM